MDEIIILSILIFGGIIGSSLSSRRFANETLYRLLAVVLVIAGVKLMLL